MRRSFTSRLDRFAARTYFPWLPAIAMVVGCSGGGQPAAPPSSGQEAPAEPRAAETAVEPQASDRPAEPRTGAGQSEVDSSGQLEPERPSTAASEEEAGGSPERLEPQPVERPLSTSDVVAEPPAVEEPPSLEAALAALKIPPDWYNSVEIRYDTSQPWKEARLEIRRLLGLGGQACREAIKLTCVYRDKNDIGDGHEYPMYLYMGGEYAWATRAYEEFTGGLLANPDSGDHVHAFLCLASCYSHFGEFRKALDTLNTAMTRLPSPPWRIARQADIHDSFGDLYARMGDAAKAKRHYAEAARLYPASNQPYGRHLLKRRAAKVQSKLDLLDHRSLSTATLRDGAYRAKALGYSGDKDVAVTVTIRSGRIADIQIDHAEKIDQGATVLIPQRIIAEQSLDVDAITGATVTCDAIRDGVFRALKQAGLE